MTMSSPPEWARTRRAHWRYRGGERPSFAVNPRDGEESVWDYLRPPVAVPDARRIVVRARQGDDRITIADTTRSIRVLETASPPTFYLPQDDVALDLLEATPGDSRCEWKGEAAYWSVVASGRRIDRIAWSYPEPFAEFEWIRRYIAFYPSPLECTLGGERVRPQPGRFYAGWVTDELVGPFKGEPGSEAW
jgi:uncharacterized protein (DUF427 family)